MKRNGAVLISTNTPRKACFGLAHFFNCAFSFPFSFYDNILRSHPQLHTKMIKSKAWFIVNWQTTAVLSGTGCIEIKTLHDFQLLLCLYLVPEVLE